MLFMQLLLNADSLKVEHQHTLIFYSHSDNLRETEHTHSHQWGITSLSPRVSVCRSRRQHGGQGSCQRPAREGLWSQVGSRADKVLSPAGQGLWWVVMREITVAWSSVVLGCGARLSQQWSGACLSYTWKVVHSPHLGLFNKCLGTPDARYGICPGAYGCYMAVLLGTPAGKWGISPGASLWVVPLCRQGCSDPMCQYLRSVSLPDVSALI